MAGAALKTHMTSEIQGTGPGKVPSESFPNPGVGILCPNAPALVLPWLFPQVTVALC